MNPSCDRIHEQMTAEAAHPRPWSLTVEEHLRGCGDCESWAVRLELHRRALADLPDVTAPASLEQRVLGSFSAEERERRALTGLARLTALEAPAELDGRVVAALHGGVRQDRARNGVVGMAPMATPPELDERLEALFSSLRQEGVLGESETAHELTERVDRDLHDLPATVVRTLLGKLTRFQAPKALAGRVDGDLRAPAPGQIHRYRRFRLAAGLATAAAAAGLALWVGFGRGGPGPDGIESLPFNLVDAHNLAELTPAARSFAENLSGGAASQIELLREVPLRTTEADSPELATRRGSSTGGMSSTRQPIPPPAAPGGSGSAGTGNPAAVVGPGSGSTRPSAGTDFLSLVPDAPFVTPYRGERRVEHRFESPFGWIEVDYREEVATDGQGLFTVIPLEVIHPPMLPQVEDQFLLLQSGRERFAFFNRDFRIRDLVFFWQNFTVTDLGQPGDVAGRSTVAVEVQRQNGMGNTFRLAIDPLTGLILDQEERSPTGELISRVRFETLVFDADLSDLQLTGGTGSWVEFDPGSNPGFSFPLFQPSFAPSGFVLQEASTLNGFDPSGAIWVKFSYGDGAEQVFLLHSNENQGLPVNTYGGGAKDNVYVVQYGAWTVAEGYVNGRHLLAVGKVHKMDLLLMLQSAAE